MIASGSYDVFISHRSLNRPWVEILARNLEQSGYKVFLDIWSLVPGRSFVNALAEAIRQARKGILVATPEAIESGWVRSEYEAMFRRSREDGNFSVVPIIFGHVPQLPFIEEIHCVDFRDSSPEAYRHAFYQLICGLEDRPPGAVGSVDGIEIPEPIEPLKHRHDEEEPRTSEARLLDDIFSVPRLNPTLLVLTQAYREQHTLIEGIKDRARIEYTAGSILDILPPCSPDADSGRYFQSLGRQCGFDREVTSGFDFESVLEERLENGENLFMVVSRFENGSRAGRRSLAAMLSSLTNRHGERFRVVLCGGERLAELKYEEGDLSLLRSAEQLDWPEATVADIRKWKLRDFPDLVLDESASAELLELCGGHPWLIYYCLQQIQSGETIRSAYGSLRDYSFMWQLFTPYRGRKEARQTICWWLKHQDLGDSQPWPSDRLLRRLYWNNLLTIRAGRYWWRCEVLREVGQEALAC